MLDYAADGKNIPEKKDHMINDKMNSFVYKLGINQKLKQNLKFQKIE